MTAARPLKTIEDHFITADNLSDISLGNGFSFVYPASDDTDILSVSNEGHVLLSANSFEKGRSVYIASLPWNLQNARLLLRSILWAAGKETSANSLICSNPLTDCAYYKDSNCTAIVNHSGNLQETSFRDAEGQIHQISLNPHELQWA